MRLPLILAISSLVTAAAADGRREVHLFKYGGLGDQAAAVFGEFRYIMNEKLPLLASELQGESDIAALEDVSRLALMPVMLDGEMEDPVLRLASLEQKSDYWRSTPALAVLTGRVQVMDGSNISITTNFFLGDHGLQAGHQNIAVSLAVRPEAYNTTKDSHSVTILTALALSAVLSDVAGRPPDCHWSAASYRLLDQADQRASSVLAEDPEAGARLKTLVNAAGEVVKRECPGG